MCSVQCAVCSVQSVCVEEDRRSTIDDDRFDDELFESLHSLDWWFVWVCGRPAGRLVVILIGAPARSIVCWAVRS